MARLAQVAVAAYRKRNVTVRNDPNLLYQDKELDAGIATAGRLLHTNQLTFFDRATTVTDGDIASSGAPRPWRLLKVHRTEELKAIIRMLPIWAAGILLVTSASHNHSFAIQQARTMDRRITARLEIPPASMLIFSNIAMLATLARRYHAPPAHRHRPDHQHTQQHRRPRSWRGRGSGWRRSTVYWPDSPRATVPMSVFWMAPQYAIHGVADAFMDVGRMEFLYDQAPESMRSSAAALYWLTISAGSYMGTLLVTAVHESTKGDGEWLQDNLNRGKLDRYYWLVVTLQMLNVVYFVVCAKLYTYKKLEVVDRESSTDETEGEKPDEKDVELQPLLPSDQMH